MTLTTHVIGQPAMHEIARGFVRTLATLGLLEHASHLEAAAALANEDTPFSWAFAGADWRGVFGDLLKHEVMSSVGGQAEEALSLTAFDEAGRPLLKRAYRITADDRLTPAGAGGGEP